MFNTKSLLSLVFLLSATGVWAQTIEDTQEPPFGNVKLCSDIQFGGTCIDVPVITGECINLTDPAYNFNDEASSVDFAGIPQENPASCTLASDIQCAGMIQAFTVDSLPDRKIPVLRKIGMNNKITSLKCYDLQK